MFFQANIENVALLSKMVQREIPRTIRAFPSDNKSVFNYSCQTLNSAEIAKKLLRQEMAQVREPLIHSCLIMSSVWLLEACMCNSQIVCFTEF